MTKYILILPAFLLLYTFCSHLSNSPTPSTAISDSSQPKLQLSQAAVIHTPEPQPPQVLSIPAIGLLSSVVPVGITESRIVDTPRDEVGWYGVKPGAAGAATMNGHFVNDRLQAGVFFRLADLKPGDDIYVHDEGNQRYHYQVVEKEVVPVSEFPLIKVYGASAEARLHLITCAGTYGKRFDDYSHRTIIYARML